MWYVKDDEILIVSSECLYAAVLNDISSSQINAMIHYILFSGHMIDKEDRTTARFPAFKEKGVKQAIRDHLAEEKERIKQPLYGIAAAACGGDILFHELCRELYIPSEIYLGLPPEQFKETSVAYAGKNWAERYERLLTSLPVHIYTPDEEKIAEPEIWEVANQWMLKQALVNGGANMTLMVLWDRNEGDGKGGTKHMIDICKKEGATSIIVDINEIV